MSWTEILCFLIVLFIYIHILHNSKTSDKCVVYNVQELPENSDVLNEMCDLRQPIFFANTTTPDMMILSFLEEKEDAHVQVLSMNKKEKEKEKEKETIPLKSLYLLLKSNRFRADFALCAKQPSAEHETACDTTTKEEEEEQKQGEKEIYYSANNTEFLQKTKFGQHFAELDAVLRPTLAIQSRQDIRFFSRGTTIPFQYDVYQRQFILVLSGQVTVHLIPPKAHVGGMNKNHKTFEFFASPFLEPPTCQVKQIVSQGQILYIPPYWWYSLSFGEEGEDITILYTFKYQTLMNGICNLPDVCKYMVEQISHKK
jgi:quercetin dioxygenase-like cupin family protein